MQRPVHEDLALGDVTSEVLCKCYVCMYVYMYIEREREAEIEHAIVMAPLLGYALSRKCVLADGERSFLKHALSSARNHLVSECCFA